MKTRLPLFWEAIRSSYWFIPTLMLAGGALLAFVLVAADERVESDALTGYWWIFAGGTDGARSVLSVVAGSVIGVAGTTFSITIAVLSLTSSQFGPRLLRNFMRDTGNQVVLGTFLSTFLYCLLVLRTIRSVEETPFVPHVAVTFGVVLAIASTGVLTYFIHHVSVSIQAGRVVSTVAAELREATDRLFPEEVGESGPPPAAETDDARGALPPPPPDWERQAGRARARSSGYVQTVDGDALLSFAAAGGRIIRLLRAPGEFVPEGTALALSWPAAATPEEAAEVERAVNDAVVLGEQRTATQDVAFLIQQMVEVAVRALSPGINDPFTAAVCLDHLGAALCALAGRRFPAPHRYDGRGRLRLLVEPARFDDLLALALAEIRHYGKADPVVALRLQRLVRQVAECARGDDRREALRREARRNYREAMAASTSPQGKADVEAAYRDAMRALSPRSGGG